MSGGQGRMLSVAREMITEPRLMLVDEPTVGLAPNLADQVYELLQTARKATPTAILLVDQNVADALKHAEDVVMMNLGKVKAAGPVAEFPETRVHALVQECFVVQAREYGEATATAEFDPVGFQREQGPELPQSVEFVDDRVTHGS